MTTTSRRALLGAIAVAPVIATAIPAAATPSIDRSAWDVAMKRYETAKAAHDAHDATYDPVWKQWRETQPDADTMIDWREFRTMNQMDVIHRLDLAKYRRDMLAGEGKTWWGTAETKQRKLDAIKSVARYRSAKKRHDAKYNIDALSDEAERLLDAMCEAEDQLMMHVPAPDHPALLWKLSKLIGADDEDGFTSSWAGFYVAQTIADMRRLLGEA